MKKALLDVAIGMAITAAAMNETQSVKKLSHVPKVNIGINAYKKRKKRLAMAKKSRRTNR